jgi:hypothetical protein
MLATEFVWALRKLSIVATVSDRATLLSAHARLTRREAGILEMIEK